MMSRPEFWLPRLTLTAAAVVLAIWLMIAALPTPAGVQGSVPRVTVDVSSSF
jgi:hypothetical protein